MEQKLFSVILLHYNQPRYVLRALDSVLRQDYSNIELVFADDCSTSLDIEQIQKYIEDTKKSNVKRVLYSINSQNQGTVKTINNAVKKCSGEYILFFAADDALCNEEVLSNFVKSFQQAEENVYMISAQCYMMDINLEKKLDNFVKPTAAAHFNKLSAMEQYRVFCKSCFLAIGATAMRKKMFDKFGYFNEEYKFIEDWSYFLHLTRNGGLVRYVDFEGLLHRDGGVSHFTDVGELPPHVIAYKYDMIKIFENEIIPYLKQFDSNVIIKTLTWYADEIKGYRLAGGKEETMSRARLYFRFPSFYTQSLLWPITRDWELFSKMFRDTACVGILYLTCEKAVQTMPSVMKTIFEWLSLVLGIVILAFICCLMMIVLIKLGLKLLRIVKRLIRGVARK